jgi:hypothetical protein
MTSLVNRAVCRNHGTCCLWRHRNADCAPFYPVSLTHSLTHSHPLAIQNTFRRHILPKLFPSASPEIFFTVENFVKYLSCVTVSTGQCNFVPCWQATGLRNQHRPHRIQRMVAQSRKVGKLKKFPVFFCGHQILWFLSEVAVSYWGYMTSVMSKWVWRIGGVTTAGLGK